MQLDDEGDEFSTKFSDYFTYSLSDPTDNGQLSMFYNIINRFCFHNGLKALTEDKYFKFRRVHEKSECLCRMKKTVSNPV